MQSSPTESSGPSISSEVGAAKDDAAVPQEGDAEEDVKANSVDDDQMSPSLQDTPDTMAGSEIWSSFHVDRSSTASTATTWSYRSSNGVQSRVQSVSNAGVVPQQKENQVSPAAPASDESTQQAVEAARARAIPVLNRKASGLPISRDRSWSKQRPSLPPATKSDITTSTEGGPEGISSVIPAPKPSLRRYQSAATCERIPRPSIHPQTLLPPPLLLLLKGPSAGQIVQRTARYSDGHQATPSKAIRNVPASHRPSFLAFEAGQAPFHSEPESRHTMLLPTAKLFQYSAETADPERSWTKSTAITKQCRSACFRSSCAEVVAACCCLELIDCRIPILLFFFSLLFLELHLHTLFTSIPNCLILIPKTQLGLHCTIFKADGEWPTCLVVPSMTCAAVADRACDLVTAEDYHALS